MAVRKYLDALCVYFWAATSLLFSLLIFGLFTLRGRTLTPEIVFTSLALFTSLIHPLNSLPWVLNSLVEARVSVRRLRAFFAAPEIHPHWAYQESNLPPEDSPGPVGPPMAAAESAGPGSGGGVNSRAGSGKRPIISRSERVILLSTPNNIEVHSSSVSIECLCRLFWAQQLGCGRGARFQNFKISRGIRGEGGLTNV